MGFRSVEALKENGHESALTSLAHVYAKLRQQVTPNSSPPQKQQSVLEALWQAEDAGALNQALDEFDQVFSEIADPKKTVTFLQNLLQAAEQVPALKAQLQDGEFLDALVQLGLTAARLNMAPASGAEPLCFFLDTLWNATSPGEVRLGAQQLVEFLKQSETAEQRLKLVQFSDNLLQATQLAPSLEQQIEDPRFVDALLRLGRAYTVLVPVASEAISQDPELFLDTLWQANNQAEIQVGAQGLSNFTHNTHGIDYRVYRICHASVAGVTDSRLCNPFSPNC
jgi:hypothetical protein